MPGTYISPAETGLYYLQSRYYDPEIGRFISSDTFMSTGQGFFGNNMFAYCLNNPVNMADYNGQDAVYLVDYRLPTGLPIVGHAVLYVQDANGNWYSTEFAGKKPSAAKVRVTNPEKKVLSRILDKKPVWGIQYVYLPGDYTSSFETALQYEHTNYGGYNLFTNNCTDYVHELLTKGNCSIPLMNECINRIDPMIPCGYYNYLMSSITVCAINSFISTIFNVMQEVLEHAKGFF